RRCPGCLRLLRAALGAGDASLASAPPLGRWRRRFGDCGPALAIAAPLWRMRRRFGECGVALANAASPWRLRRGLGDSCKIMSAIKMDPAPILPIAIVDSTAAGSHW